MFLNIHSIFESISGEAGFIPQGTWCTFIRFQGCNLQCKWCDTPKAQHHIEISRDVEDVIRSIHTKHVIVTGGEPLLQRKGLSLLLDGLAANGHEVQVETNGSYTTNGMHDGYWVMDYKCHSSGMSARMVPLPNFVRPRRMVKFVIADQVDLVETHDIMIRLLDLGYLYNFLISPVSAGGANPKKELDWIVYLLKGMRTNMLDRIVFSFQLHKLTDMP